MLSRLSGASKLALQRLSLRLGGGCALRRPPTRTVPDPLNLKPRVKKILPARQCQDAKEYYTSINQILCHVYKPFTNLNGSSQAS